MLIRDSIAKIRLLGLPEEVSLEKVMTVALVKGFDTTQSVKKSLVRLCVFLKKCFFNKYSYEVKLSPNNEIIAFYGTFWYRADHSKTFENFYNKFPYIDTCRGYIRSHKRLTFFSGIKKCVLGIGWSIQLMRKRITFSIVAEALVHILSMYEAEKLLAKVNLKQYRLAIVYSELTPDENYIVQRFTQNGIPTATMQHGTFVHSENKEDTTGIQLRSSISTYFLAWNRFTYDMAIDEGMDKNKIKVLGIPKFITGQQVRVQSKYEGTVFGVILNGYTPQFHKENIRLLKCAMETAQQKGFKFIIRYHPDMKGDEYSEYYDSEWASVADNKISISEYVGDVAFTLVSNSSVFVELIYLMHPVYRLEGEANDIYSRISYNRFKGTEDLLKMIERPNSNGEVFDYLCTTHNVFNSYNAFFKEIIST